MMVKETLRQFQLVFPTTYDYENGKWGEGIEEVLDLKKVSYPLNELLLKFTSFDTSLHNIRQQREKFKIED